MTAVEHALVWCELRELYSEAEARTWLEVPHPQLDDRCPRECSFAEVMAVARPRPRG